MTDIKSPKAKGAESKGPAPMNEEDILDLVNAVLDEDDAFHIPAEMIPEGFSVEWKRKTVLGAMAPNQATYEVNMARTRWEPVNLDKYPTFKRLLPEGYAGNSIEKEGLMLYIRPTQISNKVKEIQELKARSQITDQMRKVGQTGNSEAPRKVLGVNRTYAPSVEVPGDN